MAIAEVWTRIRVNRGGGERAKEEGGEGEEFHVQIHQGKFASIAFAIQAFPACV